MSSIRIFGAPGRYVQGAGVLDGIGEYMVNLGKRAALVADRPVLDLFGERIAVACEKVGMRCEHVTFGGEITEDEVQRLAGAVRALDVDFIIGAGGGKGIDAGKGVAHALGMRIVTVPTAASNDAPTSKIYVLYDDTHRIVRVGHMPGNPDLVVVDTQAIAAAPLRMFTAGIGDAVSKKFEVAQAVRAGGANLFGGAACRAASALADLCYDTLRERGARALADVRAKRVSADLEAVVEATVLHSGLGFESGGLSVSHAMTRGLSAVRGARECLHGHQVAFGLLVQLTLEGHSTEFIDDVRAFYRTVELPTRLAHLGLADASEEDIATIANRTMTAAYIRNFERPLTEADIAAAIQAVEARPA